MSDTPVMSDDDLARRYLAAATATDWATADAHEAEINRRHPTQPLTPERLRRPDALAQAALWYAHHRVPIFPLAAGSKIPRRDSAGFKDATTDTTTIAAWWQQWPAANIGAATGHRFDVLDIDGPDAWPALPDGLELLGRARTARPGGWHLFVPPSGAGNRAHIAGTSLDLRGLGGYVVLPPSRVATSHYRWATPLELP